MNASPTTLSRLDTALQRHEQHEHEVYGQPARRVGIIDRIALHVGIALITWGRRPVTVLTKHERLANRAERAIARVAVEHRREAGRNYALMLNIR